MKWILDHIETVLAVVAFLWAGYKAWKAGTLNTFLVERIENLATKENRDAIKSEAIAAGVQGLLGKVVVNAGLSSKAKPAKGAKRIAQTLLPLFLGAALLGGCANQQIEPYRLSVEGMAKTGDAVRPLVRKDLDPSEQAIVDAWDFQRAAGHKLAEAK